MRQDSIRRLYLIHPISLMLLGIAAVWPGYVAAESDDEFFETKIRPLLIERCCGCHSEEKGKTHGGLALDTKQGWEKGGESGPPIVPGHPGNSLLIRAVQYGDDGPQMPPEDAGGKLPDAAIALLKEWVQRGADDPRVAAARRGGMTEGEQRGVVVISAPEACDGPGSQ